MSKGRIGLNITRDLRSVILDYEIKVITRVEFESILGTGEPKAKCNIRINMIYRVRV